MHRNRPDDPVGNSLQDAAINQVAASGQASMAFNEETPAKTMLPLSTSATTRALNSADKCLLVRFIGLILRVICPFQAS
jgi:hypothetical protein